MAERREARVFAENSQHGSSPKILGLSLALALPALSLTAETAEATSCKPVSAAVTFCGETEDGDASGWHRWKTEQANEALWYTMSLGDTATVIVTDMLSDTGPLQQDQVEARLSEGPKAISASPRELLHTNKEQVDGLLAETRVFSFENNGVSHVYLQTWFKTDAALVQIVTVAPASDDHTDWKAVHSAFLAATRYETN